MPGFYGWAGIEAELKSIPLNFVYLKDYHEALDYYTPVIIASEETIGKTRSWSVVLCRGQPEATATALKTRGCRGDPSESVPELNRDLVLESQKYLAHEYQSDARVWGEMSEIRWKNTLTGCMTRDSSTSLLNPDRFLPMSFCPGSNSTCRKLL